MSNAQGLIGNLKSLHSSRMTLESLRLCCCDNIEGSLATFAEFDVLRILDLSNSKRVTGVLESFPHLRKTLISLDLDQCENVGGSLLSLSDFECLVSLGLSGTNVVGDAPGDIVAGRNFVALDFLSMGDGEIWHPEISSIQQASERITSVLAPVVKKIPKREQRDENLLFLFGRCWRLDPSSADR